MIARGAALGPDQPVILHMLDIEPAKQALEGVRMELVDAAYPLLAGGRGGWHGAGHALDPCWEEGGWGPALDSAGFRPCLPCQVSMARRGPRPVCGGSGLQHDVLVPSPGASRRRRGGSGWTPGPLPRPPPPRSHRAGVVATTDVEEAFKGVDVAILVGGFPRKVSPAGLARARAEAGRRCPGGGRGSPRSCIDAHAARVLVPCPAPSRLFCVGACAAFLCPVRRPSSA